MDLEELELRFRANYGDVLQKMDELTSLIGQKTNDMQVKIQSNLDRIQQNMNDNASKANEKAKEEVRQREEAENSKQKSIEHTASVQDDATNRIIEGNRAQAESSKEAVNQSEKSLDSLTARLQEAANMQQRIAQQTKVARETVGDIPVKQAQQEVRPKEKPRPRIKNSSFDDYQEKRIQSYMTKRPVDLGIDDEIQAEVSRAKKEIDGLVSYINEKMQQAQSMQRRIATLMASRDNLDMNKQGSQVRAMRLDDQIANAQVKMERYQNQAKALAQEMSQELNTIPNSLKRIEREMDQTEAKIERIRRTIAETKAQDAVLGRSSGNNKELKEAEAEYKRLVNRSNELAKAYSYVSSRGDELRNASSRVNTTLAQEGNTASNTSSRLNRLRNTISNVTSSFRRMGDCGSSSMRRAGTSASLLSERLKGVKMAMSMLASQLIVFTLLYQGIMMLAQGMGSALMTNRQFASSFNAIKVNLLTAFYPIYSYVLPAINALMNALRKATGWIAQFTSALTGMSLSGARSGAQGLYNQVRAMNDTSKAASKASDAVKKQQQEQAKAVQRANQQIAEANRQGAAAVAAENEKIKAANEQAKKAFEDTKKANEDLQASLMGFDELNVLDNNKNNSDNGSFEAQPLEKFTPQQKQDTPIFDDPGIDDGGAGDEGDPGIDWNVPLEASQNAIDAANKVKKVLGELFDPMKKAWDEKGQAVVDAAKYSWSEIKRLLGDVGHSFMHVWDNGTGQRTVENILQLLADMLNIIGDIARAFAEAWEEGGRGTKFIQAIFNALNNVLELIHHIATSFREAWNDGTGERIAAHLIELFTGLANIIGNLASQFDKAWQHGNVGTSIFKTLLGMVDDMLAALSDMANYTANWAKKLDFTPLLQSIDTLLKSIRPVTKDVWDGLEWAYKNVLLPLAKFTITKLIPDFFNLLAAALKLVHSVVQAAKPAFQWIWDDFFEPIAKWTGGSVVNVLKALASALNVISDWVDRHHKAVENMAKVLVTMFAFKVSTKTVSDATDFLGKIIDKATVISANKHLLSEFFGKITGLSDLKKAVTDLKTIKDVTKTLAVQNWNNFVKDAKDLAKLTWASFLKAGEMIKTLAKLSWSGFLSFVSGTKKLAVMSWTGLVTGVKALKNWSIWGKAAAVAQGALNLVMEANPIILVITAIAALVAGFVALYKHNKKFRDFCNDVWKSITKWFGESLDWIKKNWIKVVEFMINPIGAVATWFLKDTKTGQSILKWAKKLPDKAAGWAKSVGKDIGNHISKGKKDIEKAGKNIGKWTTEFIGDTQKTLKKWASGIGTNFNKDVEKSKKLAVAGSNKLKSWTTGFVDDAKKDIKNWAQKIGSNINNDVEKGKKFAKNAGTKLKEWTTDFRESASQSIRTWAERLGDHINNGSESSRSGSTNAGNKLSEWTRSFFSDANSSIHNWAGNLGGHVSNGISGAYNAAKNAGERLGSWVSDFRDSTSRTLSSWASGLGSTIGGGITSGLHNISSAVGKVVDAIVRPVQKATDKIREGINWVLGKLGGGSVGWGYFNWNAYKTGTQNHPGGLALVNDQDGDIYRESYELPNGEQGLFPAKRNFLTYLPAGTKVKTATNTANELANMVPKYAGGIGSFNFDFSGISRALSGLNFGGLFSGIGGFFDAAMDELENVTDDIAHPEKLVNYIVDKFVTYDWGAGEVPLKLAKGAVNEEKKGMMNWARKVIDQFGGATHQTGPGAEGWRSAVKKALRKNGLPASADYVNAWVRQIQTESGGNERAIGGNDGLADGNATGLLQTKPKTFAYYAFPGHGNIMKGYDNMLAAINYAKHTYGATGMLSVIGHGHGYEDGGLISKHGFYEIGEGDKPEMVIPLMNRELGMQRINEAIAFMNRNFGGGLQLPTALSNNAITPNSMYAESSSNNDVTMQNGGFKEMSTNLVNAIVQALQMQNATNSSNQPVNLHLTVKIGDESFGEHAIKGINAVNQKNGRNMLNI
ncbi:lytic transglycosylase [Limosilactobacillus reuteri]|uniref:lytic transglycosylase n=1 Tax=Limosilactobacillus reuteri TaxID=1598 RepID=UPI001C5BE79C|nr:lytic transglycosylase [Limosilactobacillus reuteri]MBW3349602.1 lytic transglycosylase [Limosilactobacillus reuteri]UUW69486.1 lytic transglycosylase [Limosilactobacillus reuteri]